MTIAEATDILIDHFAQRIAMVDDLLKIVGQDTTLEQMTELAQAFRTVGRPHTGKALKHRIQELKKEV